MERGAHGSGTVRVEGDSELGAAVEADRPRVLGIAQQQTTQVTPGGTDVDTLPDCGGLPGQVLRNSAWGLK